jgi:hypothetical protein
MFSYKETRTGPDYSLAYSALARRMAAIDALLNGCVPPSIARARDEVKAAMKSINAMETTQIVIPLQDENTTTEINHD